MVSCFHRFCPFLDVEVDILLENWVSYGLDEAIPATQQLYKATAVGPRFGCIGFEWLLRQEIGKLEKQYMMTNLVDLRSPRHTLKCAAILKKVVSMYYQPNHKHHINHIHHAINLTYSALPPYQPNYLRWFQLPIPKIFVNWWSLSLTIPNDVELHIIINNHCPISSSMGLSEHMCPEIPCFMTLWILKSASARPGGSPLPHRHRARQRGWTAPLRPAEPLQGLGSPWPATWRLTVKIDDLGGSEK